MKSEEKLFTFSRFDRNFPEFFEIFHEIQGRFACSCTCRFVAFYDLSFGVFRELSVLCCDFFYELFHLDKVSYYPLNIMYQKLAQYKHLFIKNKSLCGFFKYLFYGILR